MRLLKRALASTRRTFLLRSVAVVGVLLVGGLSPLPAPSTATAPPPAATAATQLRLGVDFPAAELTAHLADYPLMGYHRHFGTDGGDADSLPELPNVTTDPKWRTLPTTVTLHVSWKDDVEQLGAWLSTVNRDILLTWYHEPHGDVPPATYRQNAARMAQIIAAHPNRARVLGNGPVVTRFWLDEGRGNPADFWYPGATFFGIDSYKPAAMVSYPSGAYMFDKALAAAAARNVPLVVGELGSGLTPSDVVRDATGQVVPHLTGTGRAQALRGWITYLRDSNRCTFAGWFNLNAHKITAGTPNERATLQTAIELLAA